MVLHNLLLAIYSGLTCAALVRALHVSAISPFLKHGLAATTDSLCKMHGPRGYGDAVTFNPSTLQWASRNLQIHLQSNGLTPDSSDVGRIWNEGLAFWGWLFYLSKFYEVVDTIIILLKGKRSSTLQTFHHAGAMLSVWAGIRFMSPPIWMFVLVNSGLHTIMVRHIISVRGAVGDRLTLSYQYTYYGLSALGVQIPGRLKRTLTIMQILQLVVGSTYAACHLFVSYTVPIPAFAQAFTQASAISSSGISAASAAASKGMRDPEFVSSTTVIAYPWVKKLALYAAGAPNVAEKLFVERKSPARPQPAESASTPQLVTSHRSTFEYVQCLDTDGQVFAIWLNILYLAPLIGLFVRFFSQSYGRRRSVSTGRSQRASRRLSDAAARAAFKTSNAVDHVGAIVEENAVGELGEKAHRETTAPQAKAGQKESPEDGIPPPTRSGLTGVLVDQSTPSDSQRPSDSLDKVKQQDISPNNLDTPANQSSAEGEGSLPNKRSEWSALEKHGADGARNAHESDYEDTPNKQATETRTTSADEGSPRDPPPSDSQAASIRDQKNDQNGLMPEHGQLEESKERLSGEQDLDSDSEEAEADEIEESRESPGEIEQDSPSSGDTDPATERNIQALDGGYDLNDLNKKQGPSVGQLDSKSPLREDGARSEESIKTQSYKDPKVNDGGADEGQKELLQPNVYGEEASDDDDDKENIPPQSPTEDEQDGLANGVESGSTSCSEEALHERRTTSMSDDEQQKEQSDAEDQALQTADIKDEPSSDGVSEDPEEDQAGTVEEDYASSDSAKLDSVERDTAQADSPQPNEQSVSQDLASQSSARLSDSEADAVEADVHESDEQTGFGDDASQGSTQVEKAEEDTVAADAHQSDEQDPSCGETVPTLDQTGRKSGVNGLEPVKDLEEEDETDDHDEEEKEQDEEVSGDEEDHKAGKDENPYNVLNTHGEGEDSRDDLDASSVLGRPNA